MSFIWSVLFFCCLCHSQLSVHSEKIQHNSFFITKSCVYLQNISHLLANVVLLLELSRHLMLHIVNLSITKQACQGGAGG